MSIEFDKTPLADRGSEPAESLVSIDYTPIDFTKMSAWGPGMYVRRMLTDFERKVWRAALQYQDKRDDPGQGEIVAYFACLLSKMLNVDAATRETAVLAAILHDTGWGTMPEISKRFAEMEVKKAEAKEAPDDEVGEAVRKAVKEVEKLLREEHQVHSARIAREILGSHPHVDEICKIVGDHDTRYEQTSEAGRIMWDADVLWRVTPTAWYTSYRRFGAEASHERLYALIKPAAEREKYLTPLAAEISRIEFANTVRSIFDEAHFPEEFRSEFAPELKFLARV